MRIRSHKAHDIFPSSIAILTRALLDSTIACNYEGEFCELNLAVHNKQHLLPNCQERFTSKYNLRGRQGYELSDSWSREHEAFVGHPKAHLVYLADMDEETGRHLFTITSRIAQATRDSGIRCEGINLFLADGETAFQEVPHVHMHVFPRFRGIPSN
jgi:HIT domain